MGSPVLKTAWHPEFRVRGVRFPPTSADRADPSRAWAGDMRAEPTDQERPAGGGPGAAAVRLTEHATGAGCGCKLSASELRAVLGATTEHPRPDPRVLVGPELADDAGVFDLGGGRTMVQSVDVFTPVVDDARDWGRIAAANALSDVYAMGAGPVCALQILCWPRTLDPAVAAQVLDGAAEVLREASVAVIGGHSIDDPTPKFGLAVTGLGDSPPLTNAGARPGDALVLTKSLGTGVITAGSAAGVVSPSALAAAVGSMTRLNADAATAARRYGARAVTDVTGFGLVGHLTEVCAASGVAAAVDLATLPVLPSVPALIGRGHLSGGTRRNRADALSSGMRVDDPDAVGTWLACDAQTSGGLLVALPEHAATAMVAELCGSGHPAAVIGSLTAAAPAPVVTLHGDLPEEAA